MSEPHLAHGCLKGRQVLPLVDERDVHFRTKTEIEHLFEHPGEVEEILDALESL